MLDVACVSCSRLWRKSGILLWGVLNKALGQTCPSKQSCVVKLHKLCAAEHQALALRSSTKKEKDGLL
jgi:hypothetical protein